MTTNYYTSTSPNILSGLIGNATSSATYTTVGTPSYYIPYEKILNEYLLVKIPKIFKIITTKIISSTKLEIKYINCSHRKSTPIIPPVGSLIFQNKVYGVYTGPDNFYWESAVIVEFEDNETLQKIVNTNLYFTPGNQWDNKISNEELEKILNNEINYQRYAHIQLEQDLEKEGSLCLTNKLDAHAELDASLWLWQETNYKNT